MKRIPHPAFTLFKELFDKASEDPGPVLPTYFVTRNFFGSECRKRGIDAPSNPVAQMQWEAQIGLNDYAHKVIAEYHKQHGTDFTPCEKASWRLHIKLRRKEGAK